MGEGQMTPYCKGQCKGGKSYVTRFCDADQQQHMALSVCPKKVRPLVSKVGGYDLTALTNTRWKRTFGCDSSP